MTKPLFTPGLHTPRLKERRAALENVFSEPKMAKVWNDYVRKGLRDQPVTDLFDYNDFHWHRVARFNQLNRSILGGMYVPQPAMAARLEKKIGLCRTIIIPSPEDAVALQCLVEFLLPIGLKAQPSKNSFFSRSHSTPNAVFTFGRDYIWFKRWRAFSNRRLTISNSYDWIATTDIANYFDCVRYDHLRNIISELDGVPEAVLDIIMKIVGAISWEPDYLPPSAEGLPQVQFDAPRLLAHIYLYEVDRFLKEQTSDSFVRWVDDFTIAVPSKERGKRILRDLDALMHIRGIRLNSGKTHILSRAQARKFFQASENSKVDTLKQRIDEDKKTKSMVSKRTHRSLETSFDNFLKVTPVGQHDKVIRRYIGLFSQAKNRYAESFVASAFTLDPSLRETAIDYFAAIGPSWKTFRALKTYISGFDSLDDTSICQISRLLTRWEIDSNSKMISDLSDLSVYLSDEKFLRRSQYYLVSSIWIAGKYASTFRLAKILRETQPLWENSEFLCRQVAAVLSRFKDAVTRKEFTDIIELRSFSSANSVIFAQRELMLHKGSLPPAVRLYVVNGLNKSNFGLQRILIGIQVLRSGRLANAYKDGLRGDILKSLTDPVFTNLIANA